MKCTLKKAAAAPIARVTTAQATTSPAAFPSAHAIYSISFTELPVLLPCNALVAEGNGDSSDGIMFQRSYGMLEEYETRLYKVRKLAYRVVFFM